jgi:hypothetical protein
MCHNINCIKQIVRLDTITDNLLCALRLVENDGLVYGTICFNKDAGYMLFLFFFCMRVLICYLRSK